MSRKMTFPAQYASVSVGEVDYHPDKDGMISVENEDHIPELVRFGAVDLAAAIVYADQPVEDSPEPSETQEEAPATEVAPDTEDAPEAPSEPTDDATNHDDHVPSEDDTKNDLVEWLAKRGVDVPSKATKAEIWDMIQEMTAGND